MTDTQTAQVADLVDRNAVDPEGDKIGTVHDVYVNDQTGQPEWLAIKTGMFGSKLSFAPIAGAYMVDDDVVVTHSKDTVKDAPQVDADGQLTPEETDELFAYYGQQTQNAAPTTGQPAGGDTSGDTGGDTSGPDTDDAMTRSEEELDVSTRTQQTGKATLRKWIETENVQMTVPIRREKARLVTDSITDANRDAAMAGGDLTDEEHEVTLSEEVVDVSKKVEAKERVRLEKDVETSEVTVDEEVRKERIGMDDDQQDRS